MGSWGKTTLCHNIPIRDSAFFAFVQKSACFEKRRILLFNWRSLGEIIEFDGRYTSLFINMTFGIRLLFSRLPTSFVYLHCFFSETWSSDNLKMKGVSTVKNVEICWKDFFKRRVISLVHGLSVDAMRDLLVIYSRQADAYGVWRV